MWPFASRTETKAEAVSRSTLADPDELLTAILSGGFGGATASGEPVGPLSAMRVPAVLAAIRSIAETVASLDVRVMRVAAGGVREEDDAHPANAVLQHPNPWTGRNTFLQHLCFDACRHGVGYATAVRVRGEVRELIRMRPGALMCDLNLDTGEPSYRFGDRSYVFGDVVHVQPIPSDNGELTSIVQCAREGIGFASVLQKHGAQLFANGAKPGGVLAVKPPTGQSNVSTPVIKNIAAVWQATFGGGNTGKTAFLPTDATYTPLALTSVDAQYLELWRHAILQIAAAFRVPPQFLADLQRTTHSNAEELSLQFVAFCIKPWCEMVTEALERVLFTTDERLTHYIEFDYSDILRPNTLQLFEAMTKGVQGVLTPNDARQYVGKPPVEGGDALLVPLNMRRATDPQAEKPAAPEPASEIAA